MNLPPNNRFSPNSGSVQTFGPIRNLLNAVESKQKYLGRLKLAIEQLHKCAAHYLRTESVEQIFKGQTVWKGRVEVFGLAGHLKANRCYAWTHREGKDRKGDTFVTVLEIPPVESVETAVRVHIGNAAKTSYSK